MDKFEKLSKELNQHLKKLGALHKAVLDEYISMENANHKLLESNARLQEESCLLQREKEKLQWQLKEVKKQLAEVKEQFAALKADIR